MQPFRKLTSTVQPLDRANVDTDQIIPKQFLKRIERSGYEDYLFFDWRKDPDFELNHPRHKGAQILVAGKNFGCGSSREHAAWALHNYGFRCVIAPSFADIFHSNAGKNGILLITLPEEQVKASSAQGKAQRRLQIKRLARRRHDHRQRRLDNQLRDRSVPPLLPAGRPRRHRPDAAPRQPSRRI